MIALVAAAVTLVGSFVAWMLAAPTRSGGRILPKPRPVILRPLRQNLFHSVFMADKSKPPKPDLLKVITCRHLEVGKFVRVDSTEGSGWMAGNYEGECCLNCGYILHEVRTY